LTCQYCKNYPEREFAPDILRKNRLSVHYLFFEKKSLNITFSSFKTAIKKKKYLPCNTTNIYIGL